MNPFQGLLTPPKADLFWRPAQQVAEGTTTPEQGVELDSEQVYASLILLLHAELHRDAEA